MEVNKEVVCVCGDCKYNNILFCNAKQVLIDKKGKCKSYKKKEKANEQV